MSIVSQEPDDAEHRRLCQKAMDDLNAKVRYPVNSDVRPVKSVETQPGQVEHLLMEGQRMRQPHR